MAAVRPAWTVRQASIRAAPTSETAPTAATAATRLAATRATRGTPDSGVRRCSTGRVSSPCGSRHRRRIDNQSGNSIAWGDSVFDDGKFHIVALRRTNAATLAMTVDDQAARTAPVGAFSLSAVGRAAVVGSVTYGNLRPAVDFSIAELVLVHDPRSGVVADADVASLHTYLKQKYGL
jgi:hypothetical protein